MNPASRILLASSALALASLALASPSDANPFFASKTGKDCGYCHLAGRETEGKDALTPMGQSFFTAYKNCGYQLECALSSWGGPAQPAYPPAQPSYGPPAQPAYPQPQPAYPVQPAYPPPQPAYPQQQPAYPAQPAYPPAQPNYAPQPYAPPRPVQQALFMYRFYDHCNGSDSYFVVRTGGGHTLRFMLKKDHETHIEIPVGAEWVSTCGGWPSEGGSWNRANPGD